jgi:glycosyltransferase involved in cell wall biosynthesis
MTTTASTPRVSIGLPVYNGERYLAGSIQAIRDQTFQDWELIISDNASTDSTEAISRSFVEKDSRIRYVRQQKNLGIAKNLNVLIDHARGEYFKWQAHDDLSAPTLVAKCVAALEKNPLAVLAYTQTIRIDGEGATILDDIYTVGDKKFAVGSWEDNYDYNIPDTVERCLRFLRPDRPAGPAYLFGVMRTKALRASGKHPSYFAGDEVLLLDLLLMGPFVQVKEPLFFVRHFEDNATALWLLGDFLALQGRLDPALATRWRVVVSKYQRYWEYLHLINRAPLDARGKLRLSAFVGEQILGRARAVVAGMRRGERTIFGQPRG